MDLRLLPPATSPKSNSNRPNARSRLDQMAGGMIGDAPPPTLPESNSAEYASTEAENEDSPEQPLALPLPCYRAVSCTRPRTNLNKQDKPPMADNGNDTAAVRLMMDLPSPPIVVGQARCCHRSVMRPAQKMLLSLDGEINYIRKSIRQLGIKTDYLPRYDTANQHQDMISNNC